MRMFGNIEERLGISIARGGSGGGGGRGSSQSKSYGYSGTLSGITRGMDGIKQGTDCHYSTPVGSYTVSKSGWADCDKTSPAPRHIGGSGRNSR